jgi:hypothetical protein
MLRGILHIGAPKCMSTSLQAYLRAAGNVYFAGIGPSKFIRPEMLFAFQRQIVRTPAQFYNKEFVARVFAQDVALASAQGADFFALSDETILFPLSYGRADTSYIERLARLRAVMPHPTTVLMIVRKPAEYLKSTYKYRTAMNGMNMSYEEYLRRLLLLGDTNILATAKFANYAETARHVFNSVKVIAMETIMEDERPLLELFDAPDLEAPVKGRLPHENSGMPSEKFANFREALKPLGNSLDDDDFNVMSPADRMMALADDHYSGVIAGALAKEQTLTVLRSLATTLSDQPAEPCFALSDETRKRLAEYVAPSNLQLKRIYDIPTEEYGYGEF